jgi:hypothetical protein
MTKFLNDLLGRQCLRRVKRWCRKRLPDIAPWHPARCVSCRRLPEWQRQAWNYKKIKPIKELLGLNGTSRFKNANNCWKTGKSLIDINFDCFKPYSTSWLQFEGRKSKLIPPNFCLSDMERTRSRDTIYINCGIHRANIRCHSKLNIYVVASMLGNRKLRFSWGHNIGS